MFCRNCGHEIPDGATECPICHTPVRITGNAGGNERGENIPSKMDNYYRTRKTEGYARQDTPQDYFSGKTGKFVLAEGEEVIRSYTCANLSTGLFGSDYAKGVLTVTNRRMMYEGNNSNSRIAMETPIDSIGGIKTYNGDNINKKAIFAGILLILFGIVALAAAREVWFIGLILWIVAVICFILADRKSYLLCVYSSKNLGTAISIGEGPDSIDGNKAFYTIAAQPTKETYQMMYELGALVQDIQQMGDRAIDKWRQ